jgi:hypothetical protein
MEEAEIKRLKRAIHRTFGSSPHRKKYWLALVDMYAEKNNTALSQKETACAGSTPVNAVRSDPVSNGTRKPPTRRPAA